MTTAISFEKSDFENLSACPWCDSLNYKPWGGVVRGFEAVKCQDCSLIFIKNRLNARGLNKYYSTYLTQVHQANDVLNKQRRVMYQLEFDLISPYLKKKSRILDVGCSGGYFLDLFHDQGHKCFGVEFGAEAAQEASQKYSVWEGEFSKLSIPKTFDLIVFRGVIEHIPQPKTYLKKAVSLLRKGGMIFITSTPNADSLCCELFQENWGLHVPEPHLMHFQPRHFDEYFAKRGLRKVTEHFFYQETPYANREEDVLRVAEAIRCRRAGDKIDFKSPAFWGNMLSLVYQK